MPLACKGAENGMPSYQRFSGIKPFPCFPYNLGSGGILSHHQKVQFSWTSDRRWSCACPSTLAFPIRDVQIATDFFQMILTKFQNWVWVSRGRAKCSFLVAKGWKKKKKISPGDPRKHAHNVHRPSRTGQAPCSHLLQCCFRCFL